MKKRSEQEWQDLFEQQVACGSSAAQFCKINKLCPKYFSLRKKQLMQRETPSAFVPITVNGSRSSDQATTGPAFVLRHGSSALYFDTVPTPDWLAHLVRALA